MLCSCPTANSKERQSAQRGLSQATAVQIRSAALASTNATDAVSITETPAHTHLTVPFKYTNADVNVLGQQNASGLIVQT